MDDFERDLAGMLNERVAGMPASYEPPPQLLARAQRRRALKLTSIAAAALVVIVGTAGAIAQSFDRSDSVRVSSTKPGSAYVATVACPTELPPNANGIITPPTTAPRMPAGGDAEQFGRLVSFAATNDPRYVVLGPKAWSCHEQLGQEDAMVVYDSAATNGKVATVDDAPIAVESSFLWNDPTGALLACSVFDDPAVKQFVVHIVTGDRRGCLDMRTGRTVTRVSAHVARFVDADGNRGVGWMILPSSQSSQRGNDGKISVLTCRPRAGLTVTECDTIIADYAARVEAGVSLAPAVTTTTTRTTGEFPSLPTVLCPAYRPNGDLALSPPSPEPRVPSAGDTAIIPTLESFAASTDPRYVVLGPKGWECEAQVYEDGRSRMILTDSPDRAPIAIDHDWLWHGGVGSVTACSVFADPAVVQYVTQFFPKRRPCPIAGRTVTRVDARVATFVDTDGARGVGWLALPTRKDHGLVSVLTCRPMFALTVAICDTIVADYAARLDRGTAAAPPVAIAVAPFAARDVASTANGIVIADERRERIAAYDAAADSWRSLSAPPFAGRLQFVATRGDNVYAVAIPSTAAATTEFGVLDLTTGAWRSLAPVPDGVFGRLPTVGDAGRLFAFTAIDAPVQRQIALEYDIAADRWTKLPALPIRPRVGEVVQWSGKEVLLWGGGDAHQGGIDAFSDGAAYDPASEKWRKLPPAPVAARTDPANVWTGTEMLLWGGTDCGGCGKTPIGTGAAYNPATNAWRTLATAPLQATSAPAAVWTGREMAVFGALAARVPAAAYDPATDAWRTLPGAPSSAPAARRGYDATFASRIGPEVVFGVVWQSETGPHLAAFRFTIGG